MGISKGAIDSKVLEIINSIYSKMRFDKLCRMSDIHSRILLSLFSHNFITTNLNCNIFENILARIDDSTDKIDKIVFDENIVKNDEFKTFTELHLVSAAKYVT